MGKLLGPLGGLIILGYLLSTSIFVVEETDTALVTEFGRPVRVIDTAGLAMKLPDPIQSVVRMDRRLRTLDTPRTEVVTRDGKNLVVGAFTIWRVVDPLVFLSSVRNLETARERLIDLTVSEVGVSVGRETLESFFTTKAEGSKVKEVFDGITASIAQQAREELGLEVLAVRPRQLGFPVRNLEPLYKRMEAERRRQANAYRAEGEEKAAEIKARTDAEVRELLATAYRAAQIERGKGEAEAARTYAEAHAQAPELYRLQRTLEAYDKLLDNNATLILSGDTPLFRYLVTPPTELVP